MVGEGCWIVMFWNKRNRNSAEESGADTAGLLWLLELVLCSFLPSRYVPLASSSGNS